MKRVTKWVSCVLVISLFLLMLSIPIFNDYSAKKVEKDLRKLPLPEKTECIDSVSKTGKLVGNGNGMQYFGAILIKSELSLKELDDFYKEYRKNEGDCIVEVQRGQEINVIEHGSLKFPEEMKVFENYYIVYSWGSSLHPIENMQDFDLRRH